MAPPKVSGIYEIVNTVNGKRYVGSSLNFRSRWHGHRHRLAGGRHHSPHLQNAWRKYGPDAFEFRVLEICGRDVLLEREQVHLDRGCDYNVSKTAGSPLGVKHSKETRRRMSLQRRGVKKSDAHVAVMSSDARAQWSDPVVRAKMIEGIVGSYDERLRSSRSLQLKTQWEDEGYREAMRSKIAASHTDSRREALSRQSKLRWSCPEHREKVRAAVLGRSPSLETRAKISDALKGRKFPEGVARARAKLTDEQAVSVILRHRNGESYASIASDLGVRAELIGRICRRERYAWIEV